MAPPGPPKKLTADDAKGTMKITKFMKLPAKKKRGRPRKKKVIFGKKSTSLSPPTSPVKMNPVSSNRGKYKSNFSKIEKSNDLMAAIEQWPEAKANNVLMKDHAKRFNIPPSTLSKKIAAFNVGKEVSVSLGRKSIMSQAQQNQLADYIKKIQNEPAIDSERDQRNYH